MWVGYFMRGGPLKLPLFQIRCGWVIFRGGPLKLPLFQIGCGWVIFRGRSLQTPPFPEMRKVLVCFTMWEGYFMRGGPL
jgi:hypothetical protein